MRTTLDYIGTKQLNNASTSTPGGVVDPTTGIAISTGTNSGDFVELTAAQALALSKTSVGTLYEGVYQRVKLSATGASNVGLGQPLFWNDANDTTDPYPVTNSPGGSGTATYDWAGTVIDPSTTVGQYCWIQCTGKASCEITGGGAAGNIVTYPTSGAPTYSASGTTVTAQSVGQLLSAAASGTGLGLVDITRPLSKF
jgi:hypothetical protein